MIWFTIRFTELRAPVRQEYLLRFIGRVYGIHELRETAQGTYDKIRHGKQEKDERDGGEADAGTGDRSNA